MILPRLPIDNSGLNLLSQKEPLPVSTNSSEKDLLAHYAFASDPHWGSSGSNDEARKAIMQQIASRDYDAFFVLEIFLKLVWLHQLCRVQLMIWAIILKIQKLL